MGAREAEARYMTATDVRPPAILLIMKPGSAIMETAWPSVEKALRGVKGVVSLTRTLAGRRVLVGMAKQPELYTDQGMIDLCRRVCKAAGIQLVEEPRHMPGQD